MAPDFIGALQPKHVILDWKNFPRAEFLDIFA